MELLNNLLVGATYKKRIGENNPHISSIHKDILKVKNDSLFISLKNDTEIINNAIENGAIVIVCKQIPEELNLAVVYIETDDCLEIMSVISTNYYGNPSKHLKIIGVTGTNGKTTTTTLLYKLFLSLGYKCSLIGTVQHIIDNEVVESIHTTPESIELNRLLRKSVEKGCIYVFMEVSSHAIYQKRINGIKFTGAVCTNVTHDHLDYHKTFENYLNTKKLFFDLLPETAFSLSNCDDENGEYMLQNTNSKKYFYSLLKNKPFDFSCEIISNTIDGLELSFNKTQTKRFKLIGEFNAYNLLAAYSSAICLGMISENVLDILSNLDAPEGRLQMYKTPKNNTIIIDYAHSPDALEKIISTIHKIKKKENKLITVFGCLGDRDKTKRPIMGDIAVKNSNIVICTSAHPRSENPINILNEVIPQNESSILKKIVDRKESIEFAIDISEENDIILIAGKGHEKYEEINNKKYPFHDMTIVHEIFSYKS
jgi:UDP-N-acetylmuramoyl-L-alanyl-D-glutamate--2,6-diaminopimelate ligase